jgi:hypothetical protein
VAGWNADDRVRSLRDWTVACLGSPPWIVRPQRQDMPREGRPAVVVESASPPLPTRARVSVPQGNVEWVQAFSIMAYPAPGETPAQSRLEADRVAALLTHAVVHGMVEMVEVPPADPGDDPTMVERQYSPPLRIPLFDYAGVPVEGEGRAGPTEPYDWMWVDDPAGAQAVQDPLDHLLFTVPLDLRLSWESTGRVSPSAPIAASMPGGFVQP